ncbi:MULTISPECIES: metal ABC transporter solute-binding protein, Zn/Mn family [Bacillaceae]|uniref:Zinc ABC transporter substrate-binding protein n=1 Tax=Evansella alkalicola TaxID=745819 RepID=A0ABS6JXA4_9BACI|nr:MULTISPECIES: zinc ABC transporter substrate-binding protein [Bacillaceae]MBU9723221.1 zinc ABC transporter substrate-binding protein [Bacillus alkalicola]
MKRILVLFIVLFAFILTACGQDTGQEENVSEAEENEAGQDLETEEPVAAEEDPIDPLKVYTTLFPLEDFTNKIGGEYVEVENIIPAGVDAHSFEPTANQMMDIAMGDIFIYNGAGFEVFAERIKDSVESHDVYVLTAADGIELIGYDHDHDHGHGHDDDHAHGHEDDHGHGHDDDHGHGHEDDHGHSHDDDHDHGHDDDHGHEDDGDHDHGHDQGHSHGEEDPHVWLDPIRAIQIAENIKKTLVELQPDGESVFNENFEELKAQLEELDQEFLDMSQSITKDTIVVSHAGYGYWEDRYDIHQVGITGISPTNEPSIAQLRELIDYIEDNGISHIMFEQNIPANIAETVREEVGAEALWLHNLESLTKEEVEAGEDYFSLMRKNIETLRTALQ